MKRFASGLVCGVLLSGTSMAVAQVVAEVNTNGVLKGYTVQKDGDTVCVDPEVWLDFRGQDSFIVCP